MIKRPQKFTEDNSANIGQLANSFSTHAADVDAHHSNKITVPCDIVNDTASSETGYYFLLDAAGEKVGAYFFVGSSVDTSQDIVMTWVIQSVGDDAALNILRYSGAQKTDNSEALAWNVENGVADSKNVTNAKLNAWDYTIATGNYEAGDLITVGFYCNDATDIRVRACFATFYLS